MCRIVVGIVRSQVSPESFQDPGLLGNLSGIKPEFVVVVCGPAAGNGPAIGQKYPGITVIRQKADQGYGEGINCVVRRAFEISADFIFITAENEQVDGPCLEKLLDCAGKHPDGALFFPEEHRRAAEIKSLIEVCVPISGKIDTRSVFRKFGFPGEQGRGSGIMPGCEPAGSFLGRVSAIKKIGYWDPSYFAFFDDFEWLLRFPKAGYGVHFAGEARSFLPAKRTFFGLSDAQCDYYHTRNLLYFVRRHLSRRATFDFWIRLSGCFLLNREAACFLRGNTPRPGAFFLACLDFIRGKRGPRDLTFPGMMRLRRLAASFFDFGPDFFRAVRYGWRKILGKPVHRVVRVDWNIGDEIMAIPAYEALRKKYPSSRLRAEVRYPELLKHNPFLDSVGTDKSRFADRRIDLHGEDRGIPRMEYLKDRAGVDSWGVPRIYFEEKEKGEVCQKFGLGGEKLRIVLCPEASWYCRRWPLSYWFALSERLLSYHQPEICVVGTERVIFPKEAVNLAGKTTLRELAVLLSLSRLFVGCDSGPLHLAVASGVRSVGLFGPLNPDYLIAPQAHFVPLWANVDCRGCWSEGRMSNPDHCPKIFPDCMKSIPVEWVDHACRSLLEV